MVYWSRDTGSWSEDEFDGAQRRPFRSRRNQTTRFDWQDLGGSYSAITYSTDYNDRNLDDFVIKINHFPWNTTEECKIKTKIEIACSIELVYPKSIKIITDRETGKPRYGFISFNTEYELNEVLQKGLLNCCNCQRIRTKWPVSQKNKNAGNLTYIKQLVKLVRRYQFFLEESCKAESNLRNMLIRSEKKSYNNYLSDALDNGQLILKVSFEEYKAMEEFGSRERNMQEKISLLETKNSRLERLKDVLIRKTVQLSQQNSELRDRNKVLQDEMDSMTQESSQFLLEHFELEDQKQALERHNAGLKVRLKETEFYNADLEDLNKQLHDKIESLNHVFKLPDDNNFDTNFVINHTYFQPLDQIVVSSNDAVRQRMKIGNKNLPLFSVNLIQISKLQII